MLFEQHFAPYLLFLQKAHCSVYGMASFVAAQETNSCTLKHSQASPQMSGKAVTALSWELTADPP